MINRRKLTGPHFKRFSADASKWNRAEAMADKSKRFFLSAASLSHDKLAGNKGFRITSVALKSSDPHQPAECLIVKPMLAALA